MNDDLKYKLEVERAVGEAHQRAFEQTVEPFFKAKKEELWQVFQELPTSDTDGLQLVKLQMNALQMIEDQFKSHINTGMMASQQLKEVENEH